MKNSKHSSQIENDNTIWLDDPEPHDFPAAVDYLELLFESKIANDTATQLQKATTIQKKAKDIFRASQLPLLPKNNYHVQKNFSKLQKKSNSSRLYFW